MYYKSGAIILKTSDLREADKLVNVFSATDGKVRAVARGVKKPRSSLRACIQPFSQSLLHFHRGKDLDIITQGRIINFYGQAREDIQKMLYAVYMMELLDKSLLEHMPLPQLYAATLEVLDYLNDHAFNPLVIRFFELKLLVSLGYAPILNQCVQCGGASSPMAVFSMAEGGVVCPQCVPKVSHCFHLSGESLAMIRFMTSGKITALGRIKASEVALRQMESFLEEYLEYHLERSFQMKKTIKVLKKRMMLPG